MLERIQKRARAKLSEAEQIEHYTAQPQVLPEVLKRQLTGLVGDESVLAYALIDLDGSFQLAESWLILTKSWLVYAKPVQGSEAWRFRRIERSQIGDLREICGLSCNRLVIADSGESEVLLTVRYTHRQGRLVGVIKSLLEYSLEEESMPQVSEIGRGRSAKSIYAENLLHPVKEAQASVAGNQMAVVWRLLSYLQPYRTQVMFGLIGATLMTLVSLVPAFLTGRMFDQVIKPFQAGEMDLSTATRLVWILIAGLAVTFVLREIFAWVRLRTMSVLGEYVAKDLRDDVYTHLHKLSLSFFSSRQTGSLISRVGSDTDRIWDFIAFGVVEVSTSVMLLSGLGAVLIYLDWPLGLMVTLPVPVILYAIMKHGEHMQNLFLRAWRKWSALTDCLSDTIPGVRVVKAFNQEDHETKRFVDRNNKVLGEFSRIHHVWTRFWPKLMLTIHAIQVAVWILVCAGAGTYW